MSASEVRELLSFLSPEQREKLTEGLNEVNYDKLATIKGIGPSTMIRFLLLPFRFGAETHEEVKQRWGETRKFPWPIYFLKDQDVCRERHGRHRDPRESISTIINDRKTMLHILAHYNICVTNVNEHLEALRDIRVQLDIFKTMNDPIIQDYIRQISQDLK